MTDEELARISLLHPDTQTVYKALLADLGEQGIGYRVGETVRSAKTQADLWKEGTKTSQPVSWHQLGRAVHTILVDPKTAKPDVKATNVDLYKTYARLAEHHGFRQLGFRPDGSIRYLMGPSQKRYWDPYHIEYRTPYPTLVAAVKAEAPALLAFFA